MMRGTIIRRSLRAGLVAVLALAALPAFAGSGGNVLPPSARPHGYTLTDMARALALFTTGGNDPDFYPDTPFQVLFADEFNVDVVDNKLEVSGSNTITVPAGTSLYMPITNIDDSPPVLGTFPTTPSQAVSYFSDPRQLGLEEVQVIVDGQVTPIGPAYLAGPVETPLNDGGTHIITLGVFLTPLSPGTHTVGFSHRYTGDLILDILGGLSAWESNFEYTVRVVPGR